MKDSNSVKHKKIPIDQPGDFTQSAGWSIFRIMAEFVEGFEFLYPLRREVTFFGSAKLPAGSKWYEEARRLAKMLAEKGFTIITGGGPGIMEAGNRGATEGNGESIGLDIELPFTQRRNPYIKKGIGFHYFFTRKVMLSASAQAYIFFPGGYGTIDEFFEMIMLIQTQKVEKVPIVCVGTEFWAGLDSWIRDTMFNKMSLIDPVDIDLYKIVNSAEDAFELIKDSKERKYF